MEARSLKYFIALAEDLNFTRASQRLHISQPVLSRQIKELEEEIGAQLLYRNSRSVRLTEAGTVFLERARVAMAAFDDALDQTRKVWNKSKDLLRIGYMPQSLDSFLSAAIESFSYSNPEIQIKLRDLPPGRQVQELCEGRLDIGLVGHACPELETEFDLFQILEIPLCAVLHQSHPLHSQPTINLIELKDDSFIELEESTFAGRNHVIASACQRAGFDPKTTDPVDSVGSVLGMISSGAGVCLMPEEVKRLAPKSIRFVPLDPPSASIIFHGIVKRGETRSAVRLFLQSCFDNAQKK